jgi:hypothetical protein
MSYPLQDPTSFGFALCMAGFRLKQAGHMVAPQAGRSTMKDDGQAGGSAGKTAKDTRQVRLKLALRENLKRRKSQARGKGDFEGDLMPSSAASDGVIREDEGSPGK